MMTEERLAEIEGRIDAATPGPWESDNWGIRQVVWGPGPVKRVVASVTSIYAEGDADFIAHARQDISDLLAEVRRLNAQGSSV